MGHYERSVRLPGVIEQVRNACDFVVEVAEEVGLGDDGIFQCQLSVEEVFTNIIEHGYDNNADGKSIEIICEKQDDKLLISLIDEAPLFNPLELDDPDKETPLWERDKGGWGVYFVRQYMDNIRYREDDNRNRLILEKKIS